MEETFDIFENDVSIVRDIMGHAGVAIDDIVFGFEFDSPYLRFTQDEPARAVLFREDSPGAFIKIRVKNAPGKKQFWTVPEYYAAYSSKTRISHLPRAEQAAWWIRALIESTALPSADLPPVRSKKLPRDVRDSVKKIYAGFILLIRIRLLYDKKQVDHPYAYNFIRRWCRIGSNTTVSKGLKWLIENGYLRKTREEEYKPRHIMPFYALCIESIEEIVDRRDVPSLIDALGDSDRGVVELAFQTLVSIKEPAVKPLIGELENEDIQTSVSAVLFYIGKPAVKHLINATREGPDGIRQQTVATLARIKDMEALDVLEEALDDDNPDVRYEAARALEDMLSRLERRHLWDRIDAAISTKKDDW